MKLLISAIALSVLMANPAVAAKKSQKDTSPWFVQLTLGSVISSEAEEQSLADLTALGHDITSVNFDQDSMGYIFELGYQINKNWAITAGYIDFGETAFNVNSLTGYEAELIGDLNEVAPRYGNGNTYSVVYSYPVTDAIVLSADAGILYLESDSAVNVNVGTDEYPVDYEYGTSEHSLQYFLGAVVEYQFKGVRLGLQYRHYEINNVSTEWVGARFGYHF